MLNKNIFDRLIKVIGLETQQEPFSTHCVKNSKKLLALCEICATQKCFFLWHYYRRLNNDIYFLHWNPKLWYRLEWVKAFSLTNGINLSFIDDSTLKLYIKYILLVAEIEENKIRDFDAW
jgi:hypothetical protein